MNKPRLKSRLFTLHSLPEPAGHFAAGVTGSHSLLVWNSTCTSLESSFLKQRRFRTLEVLGMMHRFPSATPWRTIQLCLQCNGPSLYDSINLQLLRWGAGGPKRCACKFYFTLLLNFGFPVLSFMSQQRDKCFASTFKISFTRFFSRTAISKKRKKGKLKLKANQFLREQH